MKNKNQISDLGFILIFIFSISFSALLISNTNQKAKFASEKYDACINNPSSRKCDISYEPTDDMSWKFSGFWIEMREKIVWWDRESRRNLGIDGAPYPEELSEIMNNRAFTIENNNELYDCYVLPIASMTVYFRNFGYPQPFSAVERGEENFIVWPEIYWFCHSRGIEHSTSWTPWESLNLNQGEYFLGQGPPILRIINDEGKWFMWGPTRPNGYEGDATPKEFEIVDFHWIYGDGITITKLCNEIKYTYEDDFKRNCK